MPKGKPPTPPQTALGEAIRATREQQGTSQEHFALAAGIDRSYYSAVERGEFNITLAVLLKIAAPPHGSYSNAPDCRIDDVEGSRERGRSYRTLLRNVGSDAVCRARLADGPAQATAVCRTWAPAGPCAARRSGHRVGSVG
jgi:transcriptional regulator with XRE-family HTH domain